ncbi:peptidoglycan-binding domain-containing protein [Nocardiopsis mangrovi]|uniref:Peptidoglycan-binding domain-containing protein n=1 Tax=Nocardiopsis mangrovi TaxID=1179818 RepID=A0ABV9E1G4_9ACTN
MARVRNHRARPAHGLRWRRPARSARPHGNRPSPAAVGADGGYGTETGTAVQRLQTDYGPRVDGVLGQESRAWLDHRPNASRYATRAGRLGWEVPISAG